MATARQKLHDAFALVGEVLRVHLRTIVPVGAAVAVGSVALLLLIVLYALAIGSSAYAQLAAFATTEERVTQVTVLLMLPMVLLVALACLVWAGVAVQLANAAASDRRISTGGAALVALRRAPWVVLVIIITVLSVLVAVVFAPVLTVVGLIGLALRTQRLNRRTLITLAVPFGLAFSLAVGWSLAPVSLWLSGTGIRAALADSYARVRGHFVVVGVSLAAAAALAAVLTGGFMALVGLLHLGTYPEFIARLVALALLGPLFFVVATMHYRRGGELPPKAPVVPARRARLTRTAIAVILAMLVPMLISVTPAPARAAGSGAVNYSISVEPASPVVADTPVTLHFSATDPIGVLEPTGTITVTIDGGAPLGPFALVTGSYALPQSFSAGSHLIESQYSGDVDFAAADANLTVSAGYTSTVALTASSPTPVFGTANTLTATITTTGTPTGTVEFHAFPSVGTDVSLGTPAVAGGVATVDASSLLPGSYTLVANYSGDATHLISSDSIPFVVTAASTTTSFTITPASPSAAGALLTAHVTVAATDSPATPNGTVSIYPDGGGSALASGALAAGTVDLDFTLPPGLHAVQAYFEPDPGFFTSNIDESRFVNKFDPTVVLVADAANTALGETVQLTATVTGGALPTGTVTFEAQPTIGIPISLGSGTLDGSGQASISTSVLPVGDFDLVAKYSGDSAVEAEDSATIAHTVGKGAVNVGVISSNPAPAFGDTINFNVNVTATASTETPTGSVEVWLDGSLVTTVALNGAGAATISSLAVGDAGDRHFTVEYLGDSNFATGSGSVDLTVSTLASTTTLLALADSAVSYGDSLTFVGNVSAASGPAPTGSVQLFVGGYHVADGTLTAGAFSITTDLSPANAVTQEVWIVYPGDANHLNSESFPRRSLDVATVSVDPVLTFSPAVFGVGSTVTVTATFDAFGAGPAGGSVTFSDGVGAPQAVAVTGNTASTTFVIATTNTWINAHYAGNGNYDPSDAAPLMLTGTQVPVTVTMTDPGSRAYGEVFDLSATVVLDGGATATGNVAFNVGSMAALSPTAPVIGGVATLQVCAGDALGCPSGVPLLGTTDSTITASYAATSISLAGASAPVTYTMTDATTTTTLVMNPSTVRPNSGLINLTVTVASTGSTAVPRGHIVFAYTTGGGSPGFLANATLDSLGVAQLSTTLGAGFVYPVDGISATFVAGVLPGDDFPFAASSDSASLTIDRYSLNLIVAVTGPSSATPVVGLPATATVTFLPEAGSTATFPQPVTVISDTGATCIATATPGQSVASCELAWPTAGPHTVTAAYPGDAAFLSASGVAGGVVTTKGTPSLAPSMVTTSVLALTDATVTWGLFDVSATGTVTVVADGVTWCTAVPVADQSCTGQFPLTSASASSVIVEVTYSGDANWNTRTETTGAIVKRCVPLDVTSANASLGTVTVDTPSNCPGGEYLSGTLITVSAHPISPNVFVDWKKIGGLSFVHDSYLSTISFVVTADFLTWAHAASFTTNCYPVTARVTGHGGMSVYPATNCAIPGGGGGYLPGTPVVIYPDTLYNPTYDEHDAFYSFGTVVGATLKKDSSARPYLAVTVNSPLSIPLTFGPQCRPISVVFDPTTAGDAATVATAENCQSPQGNGFLRYTKVDVKAVSGDPTLAIVGWKLDGVAQPAWGTSNDQSIELESLRPTATVQLVHCYTLDLKVDGAQDARGREVGAVGVDVKPNCPDGSKRYLGGTEVTITPEVLVEGGAFNGWDLVRIPDSKPASGTGKVTARAKIVTMTADVTVKAGFVFKGTCSSIQVANNIFENAKIFTLDDDGCGVSQYFDLQKQMALRDDGAPQESFWHDSDRTELIAHINPNLPLDVYLSVQGDTGTCFDGVTPTGPTEDPYEWKTYGPLKGDVSCSVGGPILIEPATCQRIESTLSFVAATDPSGKVYPRSWFPNTFYLPNENGSVGSFDQSAFNWMVTSNVYLDNGTVKLADLGDDPCTRGGENTYTAGRNLAVYGTGLTEGFTVAGWDNLDPDARVEGNPVLIETDTTGPVFPVNPVFAVKCNKLYLGEGISVIDGARCPGSVAQQNLFVAGTAVQVRADQHIGDRILYGFKSGVVGGQIVEEDVTGRLIGFVVMDVDGKAVIGDYPDKTEAASRAIIQGLKIASGILAIVAPIVLGLLFPPAGIFFAFLGAAAGIVSLIPHGAEVAGVLDLINPTKITTCAARWAFSNTGNPTGGLNPGSIASIGWTGYKVYKGRDVITQNIGKFGLGASVLSTAAGLYEAGIHHAELGPQSMEQLAGTDTMTGCLDDQWRIANSNITGN